MLRELCMVSLEINNSLVLEQKQVLEQALSTNPKTQKILQKLIKQVIFEARAKVVAAAGSSMAHDPRETRKAVRTTVYKQILGANINMCDSRKAHGTNDYEPPRRSKVGQRGGNRIPRSAKTERMMKYKSYDRGMILRWQNTGTSGRASRYGNRGSIAPRNFFRGSAQRALSAAINHLSQLIDTELNNILNKKK